MRCKEALIVLLAGAAALRSAPPAAAKFSGASALEFTRQISALGPRPSGSAAHTHMETLIEGKLKGFGCRAEEDTWNASTPAGSKPMKNIIVRIAGMSGRPVVITGHYDTKAMPGTNFVGANDGGSSAGILLEFARVLCRTKPMDDIWLVWLDGEEAVRLEWAGEDNLYGSRHLAAKWSADGTAKKVKALINVDMIGDRDLNILSDYNSSNQLKDIVWSSARELNYTQEFTTLATAIEDDHIPFGRVGIPMIDIIDLQYGPNNSWWHTDRDTVDKLSARSFQVVGEVLLRALNKIGGI